MLIQNFYPTITEVLYPVHVPLLACTLIISVPFCVVVHGLGLFASTRRL